MSASLYNKGVISGAGVAELAAARLRNKFWRVANKPLVRKQNQLAHRTSQNFSDL